MCILKITCTHITNIRHINLITKFIRRNIYSDIKRILSVRISFRDNFFPLPMFRFDFSRNSVFSKAQRNIQTDILFVVVEKLEVLFKISFGYFHCSREILSSKFNSLLPD